MKPDPVTQTAESQSAAAKKHLTEELRFLHEKAGMPSLRDISREIEQNTEYKTYVSPSTLSRIFNGVTFPRWLALAAILEVLGVEDRTILAKWSSDWRLAKTGKAEKPLHDTEPTPAVTSSGSSAVENKRSLTEIRDENDDPAACQTCGAQIGKGQIDRHLAWHYELDRQLQTLRRTALRVVRNQGNDGPA
jgi:transcriptional regulator with XRE-family HTH domain